MGTGVVVLLFNPLPPIGCGKFRVPVVHRLSNRSMNHTIITDLPIYANESIKQQLFQVC